MSASYLVRFQQLTESFLDPDTIRAIDNIAIALHGARREWRDFVFRRLCTKEYGTPVKQFDMDELFRNSLPVNRPFSPEEDERLDALWDLIYRADGDEGVKKRLATLLERYHFHKKSRERLGSVFHNACVLVMEKPVIHNGQKSVDVGVDGLAMRDLFVLAECTTRYGTFDAHKAGQLELYDLIMQKVRRVQGERTKLRFEMVTGTADERVFRKRNRSQIMRDCNVEVIGYITANDRTELVL